MTMTAERLPLVNFNGANGATMPPSFQPAQASVISMPTQGETMPIPRQSSAESMLTTIQRAMIDPNIDPEKVERMWALYERMLDRDAEVAFNEAMTRVQEEAKAISTDAKNDQTRSKYATLHAVDDEIRPIYVKHGMSVTFTQEDGAPAEHVRVVAYVSLGNHKRRFFKDEACDGKGPRGNDVMTKTHAGGSAFTYGRRYLLAMIFNLVIDTDADGNRPVASGQFISKAQVQSLEAMAKELGVDLQRFCKLGMRVENLSQIQAKHFAHAVATMERKREQAPKKDAAPDAGVRRTLKTSN